MGIDTYILVDHEPQLEPDMRKWGVWFEEAWKEEGQPLRVGLDKFGDGVEVSTVFIGVNSNYGEGPPLLFETIIFGGAHDGEMWRYATWEEAERGHAKVASKVREPITM